MTETIFHFGRSATTLQNGSAGDNCRMPKTPEQVAEEGRRIRLSQPPVSHEEMVRQLKRTARFARNYERRFPFTPLPTIEQLSSALGRFSR